MVIYNLWEMYSFSVYHTREVRWTQNRHVTLSLWNTYIKTYLIAIMLPITFIELLVNQPERLRTPSRNDRFKDCENNAIVIREMDIDYRYGKSLQRIFSAFFLVMMGVLLQNLYFPIPASKWLCATALSKMRR